ncbi:MAG: alkaline phosphatase D family protein [Rhodospirillaceae bacterium]|nr:alkaline phosphatase D family protein [Rhodospirillaceae bacterium]
MPSMLDDVRSLSRRGLLKGASASALLAALMPAASRSVWANPVFASNPFSLGVASGDPLPDGVVIWTRIAPDPLNGGGMPMQAVPVSWEVSSDDRMRTIVRKGETLARPELGHSVHVEVGGLDPGRPYWYRFRAGRDASRVGRTRTAPAPGSMPASLRFANVGCQRYEDGYFTAFRHLAREELDFVFHYGDYIYEYRARNSPTPTVREIAGDELHTIVDYRNRYALYKRDADLQAAHAAHPFLSSFDDHEVDNNWAGEFSEEDGSGASPAVPPEYFALRKQMAFHAWYENMPVRRAQLPRGPSVQAYRRLRYGSLAEINVLDTRQYRDDQPCDDGTKEACPAVSNPKAQILGEYQERWLFDGLARSDATWNVLAQQVMVMRRDLGTAEPSLFSMDKWDAYPAARNRLMRHLEATRAKGVVVLTGDVHNAWAGDLKADFLNPSSATLATEFVATSISTNGDGFEIDDLRRAVLARNPHIKYFNNRRGYSVHEATRERMVIHHRAVDTVSQPGAPLITKASYAVEAAKPGVVGA